MKIKGGPKRRGSQRPQSIERTGVGVGGSSRCGVAEAPELSGNGCRASCGARGYCSGLIQSSPIPVCCMAYGDLSATRKLSFFLPMLQHIVVLNGCQLSLLDRVCQSKIIFKLLMPDADLFFSFAHGRNLHLAMHPVFPGLSTLAIQMILRHPSLRGYLRHSQPQHHSMVRARPVPEYQPSFSFNLDPDQH